MVIARLLIGGWCVLASSAAVSAQPALPDAPGVEIVKARCLSCHEADLITQQRLSRTGWTRSVAKMIGWGAMVPEADREPMLTYLATYFAPRPMESHPHAAEGEAVFKRACLSCHDADIVEQQRLTRTGWLRSVDKMIRWGAQVPDPVKDPLLDYLASKYPPR
jgi:cytochrome c5